MTLKRNKRKSMKKHVHMLAIILVPLVALILGAAAPVVWADDNDDDDGEILLEEVEFNIEFNSTDNDLGVRGFADGEPYKELEIEDPNDKTIAKLKAKKSMKLQGFAELFFESGEPTLAEVSVPEFLARFPEGWYEFEGETIEGDEIEGETYFSHVIPCGPEIDAEIVGGNVVISWTDPVTVVDPVATGNGPEEMCVDPEVLDQELEIVAYEVILESDATQFTFELEAEALIDTELVIPLTLLEADTEYEYEVIVIEASGNQTITESDFCTGECEDDDDE
jgi:hypothetical protein